MRLLSFNVYFGFDATAARLDPALGLEQFQQTDAPARLQALARFLADERPDAAGLQELVRLSQLAGGQSTVLVDFLELLRQTLAAAGAPEYRVFAQRGIHVSASLELYGARHTLLFEEFNALLVDPAWQAEEVGQRLFPILVTGSAGPEHHGVQHVRACRGGTTVELYNTHLEAFDVPVREAQARELLEHVARTAPAAHTAVLLGDFNAQPGSAVHRAVLDAGFLDTFALAGSGPGLTCCQAPLLDNTSSLASERIDYVFARPGAAGLHVEHSRVVLDRPAPRSDGAAPIWPSDHFGVLSRLEL